MEIAVEELKIQPDEIISHIGQGYNVTLMYQGKAYAKIIPFNYENDDENTETELDDSENELFGLWRDRSEMDDVTLYVRTMRRGRKL